MSLVTRRLVWHDPILGGNYSRQLTASERLETLLLPLVVVRHISHASRRVQKASIPYWTWRILLFNDSFLLYINIFSGIVNHDTIAQGEKDQLSGSAPAEGKRTICQQSLAVKDNQLASFQGALVRAPTSIYVYVR